MLLGKLALAIAAGVTLPLLSWFDYQPGIATTATPLIALYVGFPIFLKAIAAAVLLRFPVPASVGDELSSKE